MQVFLLAHHYHKKQTHDFSVVSYIIISHINPLKAQASLFERFLNYKGKHCGKLLLFKFPIPNFLIKESLAYVSYS